MNISIRRVLPLVLAILMIFGLAQTAMAETASGTVTYDGSSVDLAYSTKDIQAQLSSLTPGDEVDLEFTLANNSDTETDWYVEDSVTRAFEDGSAAADGAYSYSLSYTSSSGKTTEIYSSEVGGITSDTTMPAGLKQAAAGDSQYYYLGSIAPGDTGRFSLSIAIDGETLGNDYQSTLANLAVNFAVEPTVADEDGDVTTATTKPKTGDYTHLATYIALMAAALVLLAGTGVYALHMRKKGGSDERR